MATVTDQNSLGFLGRAVKRIEGSGLTVVETSYSPSAVLPPHRHSRPYLRMIIAGTVVEEGGFARRTCRPDTVTFHPPGECHRNRFGRDGGRCLNVILGGDFTQRLDIPKSLLATPCFAAGGEWALLMARLYREFLIADQASGLGIEGLTLELLSAISRSRSGSSAVPAWFRRCLGIVGIRFADKLHLGELAAEMGVSPSTLHRGFRRFCGCSFSHYLVGQRVERAAALLASSDLSLAEIAQETGFADQSHFTRFFKRYRGLTPAKYRLRLHPN